MKSSAESLKVVLIEIGKDFNLYRKVVEATQLHKSGAVDKILLYYPDFQSNPGKLSAVHQSCTDLGVPGDDVIIDEPDLASFVRESKEGVKNLVVVTTWLRILSAWYRFSKQPEWVWQPMQFHIAGII